MLTLSWSKSERLMCFLSDPSFVKLVVWKSTGMFGKSGLRCWFHYVNMWKFWWCRFWFRYVFNFVVAIGGYIWNVIFIVVRGNFALHSINLGQQTFDWFFDWTIWTTKFNIIQIIRYLTQILLCRVNVW